MEFEYKGFSFLYSSAFDSINHSMVIEVKIIVIKIHKMLNGKILNKNKLKFF